MPDSKKEKAKQTKMSPTNRWVVVVRNCESDFAKIYKETVGETLKAYFEKSQRKKLRDTTTVPDQANIQHMSRVKSVAVRAETHSAEVELCHDVPASNDPFEFLKGLHIFGRPAHFGASRNVVQRDLVSAQATVNMACTSLQLKKALSDLPGFLSVWKIRSRTFRVVFTSLQSLFAAKAILDEFEAEGLRIGLTVPEPFSTRYEDFLQRDATTVGTIQETLS